MNNIKALEKLRELCADVKSMDFASVGCDAVLEIAEEIEQEIAERYMELPLDAEGVPIHVGDLIEFGEKGERLEVTHIGWTKHGDPTIAYRRPNGTLDSSCIGSECRHVKPRTIEDVLREFGDWYAHTKGGCDESGIVAEYADKLREVLRDE